MVNNTHSFTRAYAVEEKKRERQKERERERESVHVITGDARSKANSTRELYLAEGVKTIHRRRLEA